MPIKLKKTHPKSDIESLMNLTSLEVQNDYEEWKKKCIAYYTHFEELHKSTFPVKESADSPKTLWYIEVEYIRY